MLFEEFLLCGNKRLVGNIYIFNILIVMGSDLVWFRVLVFSEKLLLFLKSSEWVLWVFFKGGVIGRGLVRVCWIRICSGSGGSLEGIWDFLKFWFCIFLGIFVFWFFCWEMFWNRFEEEENLIFGIIWKVLVGIRGDRGGSGGMWVGSGGDGDEGGIISGGFKYKEIVFFFWLFVVLVVNEVVGFKLGIEVDGMFFLGGKGGDGFDSIVLLFIVWDSLVGEERVIFCYYGLLEID